MRAEPGGLALGLRPSSACVSPLGSGSTIASLQLVCYSLAILGRQSAGAARAVQRLTNEVRRNARRNGLADRRGHVHRADPLPPGDAMCIDILVVDLVALAASPADASMARHCDVDAIGIDVADVPCGERGVVAEARLRDSGPQHGELVLIELRLGNLRDPVDAMRHSFCLL